VLVLWDNCGLVCGCPTKRISLYHGWQILARSWRMKKIERVLSVTAGILLVAIFVLCILQVIFRYVLRLSLTFTEEFARMSYIWMVYLMLPVLESRDEQLKVTYFFEKFPRRAQAVIYWFMTICYAAFLLILTYASFLLVSKKTTVTFASTSWLKVNYQYIPILIGSVLAILFVIRRAVHMKDTLSKEKEEYQL